MKNLISWLLDDRTTIKTIGCLLFLLLLGTIWWDQYLPMQDYPQHLFMAEVASSYEEPGLDWQENFELREDFGPYRATSIALKFLSAYVDVQTGGKLIVSLYVLLVGLLAHRVFADNQASTAPWGALLFFPLCFHPLYFYGFVNYTLSIPVLMLALLQLKAVISERFSPQRAALHGVTIVALFTLHPSTFQVYIVLAAGSALLLGWGGRGFWLGMACALLAAALFAVWSYFSAAMANQAGDAITLESLQLTWWPMSVTLSFLALFFTGLRIVETPVWWVAAIWVCMLFPLAAGLWRARLTGRLSIGFFWLAILSVMAIAGYFVLPFRVRTDIAYTYFNARLAPVALFLFAAFMAGLPIGQRLGRFLALASVTLTVYSTSLHHRVAGELESYIPIFDKMEANAAVLPLWTNAPSAVLDPFFYTNFYSHFPFYYHVLKGGGVNPMLFGGGLMPVAFKEGRKPTRIVWDQVRGQRFEQYDYILTTQIPNAVIHQLNDAAIFLDKVGPWRLYKVEKVAQVCCENPNWRGPRKSRRKISSELAR